jgi:hypothetical protein
MRRDSQRVDWLLIGVAIAGIACALFAAAMMRRIESTIDGRNFGYTPNPEATRQFLAELDKPRFAQAGAEVVAKAQGKDAFLWRFADKAHREVYGQPFGPWKQGIGDCVSMGWAMGSFVGQSVDHALGRLPAPPLLVATEAIYGGSRCESRGITYAGYSDGSYGAAAARWCAGMKSGIGGILYRQDYGNGADLRVYDPARAKEWGAYGCGGKNDAGRLDKLANEHRARNVALIETVEQCAASLESGFPVVICCGLSFSTTRDEDGFAKRTPQGWAHCQCAIAVRYAKNAAGTMRNPRDGILIINSWGSNWQGGGKNPADQPDGSYWITFEDAQRALSEGDSFSIAGVDGFRFRELDHGGWVQPPIETISNR